MTDTFLLYLLQRQLSAMLLHTIIASYKIIHFLVIRILSLMHKLPFTIKLHPANNAARQEFVRYLCEISIQGPLAMKA